MISAFSPESPCPLFLRAFSRGSRGRRGRPATRRPLAVERERAYGLRPPRPRIVNRQANREITSAACAQPPNGLRQESSLEVSAALRASAVASPHFELLGPDDVTVDSQLRWAASAVPIICANPTVSPRADCPCQRRRRNSDKQLGMALVVADRLLLADEMLGNVFQQVGFLEGFSKKGVDPDLSREAPVFVRGAG